MRRICRIWTLLFLFIPILGCVNVTVQLTESVEPVHQPASAVEMKDNLGIAYVIHDNDDRLDLSKIESTESGDGAVELSGELTIVNDARIEETGVTINFYDEKGKTIGGFGVLARKMPTTNRLIFYLNTKLSIAQIGWYKLQWDGP